MRRSRLGVFVAVLAATVVVAAPARAAQYEFVGDKGTRCSVEVGANASTNTGALGLPHVGFIASPTCVYRSAVSVPAGAGNVGAKGNRKTCKPKRAGSTRHRGCKRRKARGGASRSARASAPLSPDALLDLAKLKLLGPLGLGLPGAETVTAGLNGYTCVLAVGSNCTDSGTLSPAVPLVSYFAQYSIRITPPAGESWVSKPPQCSAASATECVLTSESVSPSL